MMLCYWSTIQMDLVISVLSKYIDKPSSDTYLHLSHGLCPVLRWDLSTITLLYAHCPVVHFYRLWAPCSHWEIYTQICTYTHHNDHHLWLSCLCSLWPSFKSHLWHLWHLWPWWSRPSWPISDIESNDPNSDSRSVSSHTSISPPLPTSISPISEAPVGEDGKLTYIKCQRWYNLRLCMYCGLPGHITWNCPSSSCATKVCSVQTPPSSGSESSN